MSASTTRTVKAKFDGDASSMIAAAAAGEKATEEFTDSTARMRGEIGRTSKVSDQHAKALGRLRVAQLKLDEARRKGADGAQLAAAEESLAAAKRAVSKFEEAGDDSGKGFTRGLRKWFSPSSLGKTGQEGGTVFGSGFLGALKTPVLGPALVGVLGAAVAVAAPAVGAIAAAGIVAGAGAGITGIGIKFAAESDQVKARWRRTATEMGADMRLFSQPFESTLVHTADVADRTFDGFGPSLQRSFRKIAPAVDEFVDQTGDALSELEPAVEPLSDAFTAVLHSLGPAMQSSVRNVSTGLQDLAESVKENPDGLADLVDGVGSLTNKALGAVSALNSFNGLIEDMTGGTSAVDIVFGKANSTIGSWIGTVQRAVNPFGQLKNTISGMITPTASLGSAVNDQGRKLLALQAQYGGTNAAMGQARSQFERQRAATAALAATYDRQKAATDALIASLFRQQGVMLGLSGAQVGYQQALDDASASVRENGRTLDINTEKGRANRTSLNSLAQAANQQTQAMIESGQGTFAAARSAESSRANFVRLATQMGLGKAQAVALARQLIAIPNVTRTARLEANKKDLETKLAQAKAQLKTVPASKRTALLAQIADLEAGIYRATHLLASVPTSKTVTIRYTSTGIPTNVIGSAGRKASGGIMQPGRRYLLGERRREIVEMGQNGGARVISGEQTPRELAQPAAGPMVAEIHIEIGGEVVRVVRTEIATDKRSTKRKVTAR